MYTAKSSLLDDYYLREAAVRCIMLNERLLNGALHKQWDCKASMTPDLLVFSSWHYIERSIALAERRSHSSTLKYHICGHSGYTISMHDTRIKPYVTPSMPKKKSCW